MTEAHRDEEQYHQCVCVLVHGNGVRDQCAAQSVPMDQAFCDFCENVGHPDLPHQDAALPVGGRKRG